MISTLFGELLDNPNSCERIRNLYKFETFFIPKKTSQNEERKYRPICCNECLLNVFHKILLRKLQNLIEIPEF